MKQMIPYLIFIMTILAFIIKTHHFNWLLSVGIVSAIGLLLIVFYNIGEEANINATIDKQIEEERLEREKNMPKPKEIEYYKDTKTTMAEWNWLNNFDDPFRGLRKYLNVEGGNNRFYLVTYGSAKFSIYYDPDIKRYVIHGIGQESDLSIVSVG